MDRLIDAIERMHNPSVVGLDPTPQLVPEPVIASLHDEVADTVEDEREIDAVQLAMAYVVFNQAIIDAVCDIVPAVKPQIAMYEALGPAGVDAYAMTCDYAHERGLYVVGDVKRGDIGSTAAAYAHHLSGVPALQRTRQDTASVPNRYDPWREDAITVNPYLGVDGIAPFVEAADACDKDLFVLVHTSNPSSVDLQELELRSGGRLYEHVAGLVETWGRGTEGEYGYSRVGGVFGATFGADAAALRRSMPHTMLLVPGYGAQGGTADDVAGMFDAEGRGAVISSSRGIIGAWRSAPERQASMGQDDALELVAHSARRAAIDMRDALRDALDQAPSR